MTIAVHIFAQFVAGRLVRVADAIQSPVSAEFVRVDGAARPNVLGIGRVRRPLANVRNESGHNVATTLQHSEDGPSSCCDAERGGRHGSGELPA